MTVFSTPPITVLGLHYRKEVSNLIEAQFAVSIRALLDRKGYGGFGVLTSDNETLLV